MKTFVVSIRQRTGGVLSSESLRFLVAVNAVEEALAKGRKLLDVFRQCSEWEVVGVVILADADK